jgi:hypothetical protein
VLVLHGQETVDQLLEQLHDRAHERGCHDWLEQALQDVAQAARSGPPRISALPTAR